MAIVRFAARDPGGANALIAVVERTHARYHCDVWAMPHAAAVFRHAGVPCQEFRRHPSPRALAAAWRRAPADLLVTATSHHVPFEATLWTVARRAGIPSLAVSDSWMNTRARFRHGRPDDVCAIDAGQARELRALGFGAGHVFAGGSSWLDRFRRRRRELLAAGPAEPFGAATRVLFVGEPIAADIALGINRPFGFDEFDSFHYLWRGAAAVVSADRPIELAIKFHPYQKHEPFLRRLRGLPRIPHLRVRPLPKSATPHTWVLWADLVAGVSSMLMLEAIVLDRPVVSLQPNLRREETFVASARGCARTLVRESQRPYLQRLLRDATARRAVLRANRQFLSQVPRHPERGVCEWIGQRLQAR